jgi:hypothetical protein
MRVESEAEHVYEALIEAGEYAPRFRFSGIGETLLRCRAVLVVASAHADSEAVVRDCEETASRAASVLAGTIGALVLDKQDVQSRFDELRVDQPSWPEALEDQHWGALLGTYYLRDISDVILSGGGFWEAIDAALFEVFGY